MQLNNYLMAQNMRAASSILYRLLLCSPSACMLHPCATTSEGHSNPRLGPSGSSYSCASIQQRSSLTSFCINQKLRQKETISHYTNTSYQTVFFLNLIQLLDLCCIQDIFSVQAETQLGEDGTTLSFFQQTCSRFE